MRIAAISFSPNGDKLNKKICNFLAANEVISSTKEERIKNDEEFSLNEWTRQHFNKCDVIIFIGAMGIAVRGIAPFVKEKDKDPAVIVIDELGKHVIPVLSGHIGGGNKFAKILANEFDSEAVITTATDINNIFSVDTFAVERRYTVKPVGKIKYISGALLMGENIGIVSPFFSGLDEVFAGTEIPANLVWEDTSSENGISISPYKNDVFKNTLHLIPKCIVLGVGSKKDISENALIELVRESFEKLSIYKEAVKCIASIDIKKEEKSILALKEYLDVPAYFYSAEELNEVKGQFKASDFVKNITGTDNVCDRSAVKAMKQGNIIASKIKGNGVTLSIGIDVLD